MPCARSGHWHPYLNTRGWVGISRPDSTACDRQFHPTPVPRRASATRSVLDQDLTPPRLPRSGTSSCARLPVVHNVCSVPCGKDHRRWFATKGPRKMLRRMRMARSWPETPLDAIHSAPGTERSGLATASQRFGHRPIPSDMTEVAPIPGINHWAARFSVKLREHIESPTPVHPLC